jgi:hypothetical protein
MKPILILLVLLPIQLLAQEKYDSITISNFTRSEDYRLFDTIQKLINAGTYSSLISGETNLKNISAGKTRAVALLAEKIRKNGTDDISKCFIPRHSLNYYRKGKIATAMLVCFECDGIRFSNYKGKTFIKSAYQREKQMKELKDVFAAAGLVSSEMH